MNRILGSIALSSYKRNCIGSSNCLVRLRTKTNQFSRISTFAFSSNSKGGTTARAIGDLKDIYESINQTLVWLKSTNELNMVKEIEEKEQELKTISWETDRKRHGRLTQEIENLKGKKEQITKIEQDVGNLFELGKLANEQSDESLMSESYDELLDLESVVHKIKIESLMTGEDDANDCFIEINAGAGGTEAMAFAQELMKMYENYWNSRGANFEIKEESFGAEAGIRSCTCYITQAEYAYGYMKMEAGTHRVIRNSIFDSKGRRHTSFAQVGVYPIYSNEELDVITLNPSDLRIDTFRSSGPGGQSVNRTESAVRVTHIPTGLSCASQYGRSQHQNKEIALNSIKSKMLQKIHKDKMDAKMKEKAKLGEASFGNQIRSYTLSPYRLVKDHRNNAEFSDVEGVLDGSRLHQVIESCLLWNSTTGR